LSPCQLHKGEEAHCVLLTANGSIVATGNGTRGAIFALYALAETVLGVDPWWRITDHAPAYRGSVPVPAGFRAIFAPPAFRYRGVFMNDEDLLGYFRSDPLGESVFDLRTWDTIYETLLRAKANMIIPGTSPNPDERHIALANRRGLAVSQSHFEVMDFGAFQWLQGNAAPRALYNWTTNPDAMAHAWRAAIAANADKDMIWTVGLRGLWDYTYCPKDLSEAECGQMVSGALANQTAWIRAAQPAAKIITYLWSELLSLFKSGDLIVPEGVKVVFTDSGKGHIGGLEDIHLAEGLYYHTAMLDGSANQLTEMISPALIFSQLWALVSGAAELFYFVDNVSDMLPVPLSTGAALQFAWDPTKFAPDGNATDWEAVQQAYLETWATTEYGADSGKQAAALYAAYFAIPHVFAGRSDEWIGASLGKLGGAGSQAIRAHGVIDNATRTSALAAAAAVAPSLVPCAALWGEVTALAPSIPARRQQFYSRHMLWPSACQHFGVVAIHALASSLLAADGSLEAISHANASMAALDSLFAAQRAAEGAGEWSGLYSADRLPYTTLQSRRRAVLDYQAALLKLAKTFDSGKGYYSFYQYQAPAIANYPLFYHSDEWSMRDLVLMNVTGLNSADGGSFTTPAATVTFLSTRCRAAPYILPPGPGSVELVGTGDLLALEACKGNLTARYTTDGSSPTNSSTAKEYARPFEIQATTTVKALVVTGGASRPLVHTMTYTKLKAAH
jgi:hypothetical protein